MPRLGVSLLLASLFLHMETAAIALHDGDAVVPLRNDSWGFVDETTRLQSIGQRGGVDDPKPSPVNQTISPTTGWTIKKCCPWGDIFDADGLVCRNAMASPRDVFLRKIGRPADSDLQFAIGVPDCSGSALYSVAYDGANGAAADDSCVDEGVDGAVVVSCGDPSLICKTRPCIRKCKPLGECYGGAKAVAFTPSFYDLETLKRDPSATVSGFGVLFGMTCEGGKIRLDNNVSDHNYLGTNGSLYVPGHRESQVFAQDEYCIEYVHGEGIFAFLCAQVEVRRTESMESYVLLGLGFIASCVCLLATFFVYLCARKSRSLYGKTLLFYVGCLCIAYLSLAIVHLGNDFLKKGPCVLLGYTILLSFLAAFFWLNVMSVDIWKTFRSLRAAEWRKTPGNDSRFTAYSIYAWGTPLAITLICGSLDALPEHGSSFNIDMIRPKIGSASCWFSRSTYGMYVFFVAPVSLIITCNIVLYVSTAWRCWKVMTEINKLGAQSNRSRGKFSVHRDQLILNGKLFIVMGVSWGAEFISTCLPHPLWKVTDALNTLLGVFIFVIFVMKKKVINNVSQKVRDSLRSLSTKATQGEYQKDFLKGEKACISAARSKVDCTCKTNI